MQLTASSTNAAAVTVKGKITNAKMISTIMRAARLPCFGMDRNSRR